MSADTLSWVFKHSPYTGTAYTVHIVLGDLANEQNQNRLFMTHEWVAQRARTTRKTVQATLSQMVEDGMLKLITSNASAGKPNVYEFLMPEGGVTTGYTGCNERLQGGVTTGDRGCNERLHITQENSSSNSKEQNTRESSLEIEASPAPSETEATPPSVDFESEFEELWPTYPRRTAKQNGKKAWVARRRAGVSYEDLKTATVNYARQCAFEGKEDRHIMHAATFYGPNDRYVDYLKLGSDIVKSPRANVDTNRSGGGLIDLKRLHRERHGQHDRTNH